MNAALASMLPNLACRCNFGLQLRCQLTRVIATTPSPTGNVKPNAPATPFARDPLLRAAVVAPGAPAVIRNGRLRLILISSSKS